MHSLMYMRRLKEKLGSEPSDKQLAHSLNISCSQLKIKLLECSLAKEKLTMCNVRLVISIAQKYDNMGADMDNLIQVPFPPL
jgi:RNA polymerase primary sigma factor